MDAKAWTKACMQKIKESDKVSDKMIEYFMTSEERYLLGTNRQAAVCLELCRYMKVDVSGLIITDILCDKSSRRGYWKELAESTPVYTLEQIRQKNKNAYVLMTVGLENYDKGERVLREHGFTNIYRCEWSNNRVLRQIAYEVYKNWFEEWEKIVR